MQRAQKQLFSQVVKRALGTPVSLGLLTGSFLLLLTTPLLWPVALAAIVAELALLHGLVRSDRFVCAVRDESQQMDWRRQAERVGQVRASVDGPTGERIGRIQELHERLMREWDAPDGPARLGADALGISRYQVSGLLDQCLRLAQKRHQLQSYLRETNTTELQRHAVQLQEKWERCHDDVARQLYEHALRQKRSELENYAAIQQAVARVDGQLEAIECSFSNLLGKVVRLRAADATSATAARDQLSHDLKELMAGVAALEDSVNEALSA